MSGPMPDARDTGPYVQLGTLRGLQCCGTVTHAVGDVQVVRTACSQSLCCGAFPMVCVLVGFWGCRWSVVNVVRQRRSSSSRLGACMPRDGRYACARKVGVVLACLRRMIAKVPASAVLRALVLSHCTLCVFEGHQCRSQLDTTVRHDRSGLVRHTVGGELASIPRCDRACVDSLPSGPLLPRIAGRTR